MNFNDIPPAKKIGLVVITLVSVALTVLLAYALVYAPEDSFYKKDVWIIGLVFLGVCRYTIWYYKSIFNKN